MNRTIVLASWMRSSLPLAWQQHPLPTMPKPNKLTHVESKPKISLPNLLVKEMAQTLFSQSRQKRARGMQPETETLQVDLQGNVTDNVVFATKKPTFCDNTRTLIVQATKYLVEANKKNQLPHQIAVEEFNSTARDIVKFLDQLATQAGRQAEKASKEILAFSQQAQASVSQSNASLPESNRLNIFQLTQGALRYIDPHSFFKDSQLYNQSVAKLSEMVARGVASETSVVTAKKKGLSF